MYWWCRLPAAMIAAATLAFGQSSVSGKVFDPQGRAVPAATIHLETASGYSISTTSDREGRYRFAPVPNADYQLRAGAGSQMTLIQLDSRYYKRIDDFEARFPEGAPSLRECTQLTVHGDVRFGAGVVCRGAARVANHTGKQRRISAGIVIADAEVDLA